MRSIAIALFVVFAETGVAAPLNVDEIPDRPERMQPDHSRREARMAFARGNLPSELIPKRYLRNARIPRIGRYYDAEGNVYRWSEVHLAAAQCSASTGSVGESDRHAMVAAAWSSVASSLAWTGLGALAYVPMYNHSVKASQHWAAAIGAYNDSNCGSTTTASL